MQSNPNTKIYIIAAALWLVVIGVGVGFFMLGGLNLVTPDYVSLRSVYMNSANEGWAGGVVDHRNGNKGLQAALFHYSDGKWQEYASNFSKYTESIYAVSMSSANEGWAAGDFGAMLHYKGGTWTEAASTVSSTIESVSTLSPNDVWAVEGNIVAHYNGSSWLTQTLGSNLDLKSIQMLSANEGWAVGRNVILHYKDGTWSKDNSFNTDKTDILLMSVHMLSPTEGIVSGESFLDKPQRTAHSYSSMTVEGAIFHYHNGVWTKDRSFDGASYDNLTAAALVSPDEGWVIGAKEGDNIQMAILHYKSGQWSEDVNFSEFDSNSGLSMLSANEGWAVFGKHILHYQDGGWHE